jgi:hypothetical protein
VANGCVSGKGVHAGTCGKKKVLYSCCALTCALACALACALVCARAIDALLSALSASMAASMAASVVSSVAVSSSASAYAALDRYRAYAALAVHLSSSFTVSAYLVSSVVFLLWVFMFVVCCLLFVDDLRAPLSILRG